MNLFDALALFTVMLLLAALPSASVALVLVRSATLGVTSGLAVAAGIVVGDLLFVALAVLGLSVLAEVASSVFVVAKMLGGLYLLWLGFGLLRKKTIATAGEAQQTNPSGGLVSSFMTGLLLTLADVKAIVFYASLFPQFVDLTSLAANDLLLLVFITAVSIFSVKAMYALLASRLARYARGRSSSGAPQKVAGGLLVGAGGYVLWNG